MISKELVGQILGPIIFQRKRGGVSESDFHHLVRSVLQVSNPEDQHQLIKVAIEMIGRYSAITRQASHNTRIDPFSYKTDDEQPISAESNIEEFERLIQFYSKDPNSYLPQLIILSQEYLAQQDKEIEQDGKPSQTTWDRLTQIEHLLKKAAEKR